MDNNSFALDVFCDFCEVRKGIDVVYVPVAVGVMFTVLHVEALIVQFGDVHLSSGLVNRRRIKQRHHDSPQAD